jgi:hypothetical protein
MNFCRLGCVAAALLGLTGCPEKETEPKPVPPPPPPTAAVVASTPTEVKPEGPVTKPGIEPRIKTELDNRADGLTGTPLAATGAKASLQTPTAWTATKGDITVAAPADKKAQLGATGMAAGESAATKLPAVVSALGLASSEWGAPETLTVGKTKLASSGADGHCMRGATPVKAAWVAPAAEGLLVVGAWDPDGDSASVFGSMRSIAKAGTGTGDSTGIGACCSALRGNAKVAPPDQQPGLLMAASICDGIKADPNARAMLGQVRAALKGAQMPASCQ